MIFKERINGVEVITSVAKCADLVRVIPELLLLPVACTVLTAVVEGKFIAVVNTGKGEVEYTRDRPFNLHVNTKTGEVFTDETKKFIPENNYIKLYLNFAYSRYKRYLVPKASKYRAMLYMDIQRLIRRGDIGVYAKNNEFLDFIKGATDMVSNWSLGSVITK